ncbi:MAG: GNAT family N-acetyltransferase [Chloroflexota bacterium]
MTRETFSRRINAMWAEYYNQDPRVMARSGTTLIQQADYTDRRVVLYTFKRRVFAQVAPPLLDDTQATVRKLGHGHTLTVDDLVSDWGIEPAQRVQSTVYHLYPPDFIPATVPDGFTLRRLEEKDDDALARLRGAVTEDEAAEGDVEIEHDDSTGVFDSDRLTAVASSYIFRGFVDVGVLTHAKYRKKGLGTAVVSAVISQILDRQNQPIYRAAATNVGSVKIAERLGFRPYVQVSALVVDDDLQMV